jgi:hypothetical protein
MITARLSDLSSACKSKVVYSDKFANAAQIRSKSLLLTLVAIKGFFYPIPFKVFL